MSEVLPMPRHYRLHDHDETPVGSGLPPASASDPAQESLSRALKAGFNVLRVIIIVLLIFYFLSGWFQVNPGEQGIIVRLGKLRTTADGKSHVFREGWHFSLPDPFDEKIRISGESFKERIYTFCFKLDEADRRKEISDIKLSDIVPSKAKLQPGVDCTMLCGDRNLAHGLWAVEYRIDDAASFVQNVGDHRSDLHLLLRHLTENAIVRTVAGLPVERVIRTQTDEVTGDFTLGVKRRLSEELAKLNTGVTVVNIEAQTVEPGRVRTAFLAVSEAKSERKKDESKAEQEANRILSRTAGPRNKYEGLLAAIDAYGAAQTAGAEDARLEELRGSVDEKLEHAEGDVAIRLRQAQSRANEIRERVQQEYELFVDYRDTFRKYPALTAVRLWVRMRDAILSSGDNEIFFVPEAGEIEIITNRDVQRQMEADLKRYQKRYQPGAGG
jgi:regulator of protease activity HflC (stomatin/prohibitin superfamily)